MVQASIIHRIESLKEEITVLQPLSKEAENTLWKKLRLEWNYNSNHIEGNTLSYGETRLLLMFDKTTGDHSKREYDEMEAHDAAIFMVQDWAEDKDRVLTEADIRELNKVILVKPFWKEAMTPDGQSTRRKIKIGDYKEHPNSVRLPNGEMFDYARPEDVPMKMQELMDWYRSSSNLDPVILAAELHYRFIRIHPFDDGNGRVARLLVNYVLMLNELPPVVIKSAEKTKYLTALEKADVGDRDAFHSYMAEQLIWSLELNLKAANGEDIEEDDDWKKKAAQLERKLKAKPKVILKSDEVMKRVMNEVYAPFLKTCQKEFTVFDSLFRNSTWHLPMPRTERTINSFIEIPGEPQTFDDILSSVQESFTNPNPFSEGLFELSTVFRLFEKFNDDDDGFDMGIIIEIGFFEEGFKIDYFIGDKQAYAKTHGLLQRVLLEGFLDVHRNHFVEKGLGLVNYNQDLLELSTENWANEIGKVAYDWLEKEEDNLIKYREQKRNNRF